MKRTLLIVLLAALFLPAALAQFERGRTGYEGDYFSLEGALELFKQSDNLRDFERLLNTRDQWVNNLDLNFDGRTDYIRVEHRRQGNFHAVVLQAIINRYDLQDVAVIEIEQTGRQEAILQIIGDEDLYGEEIIVEPISGYASSRGGYHPDYGEFVNVYFWRPVQDMLRPQYAVYASPYRWQYYPTWWTPWRPLAWNVFRPQVIVYHRYYHVAPRLRVVRVHNFYRPYRSYCYDVVVRTNQVRVKHGRQPIHRPRIEHRPGVNNQRGSLADRSPAHTGVRSNVPERRSPASARTAPDASRKPAWTNSPAVSPQSRSTASDRQAQSAPATQRRTPTSARTAPDARRTPARTSSPAVSPQSRSTASGRQVQSAPATQRRTPTSARTAPANRQAAATVKTTPKNRQSSRSSAPRKKNQE